MLAPQRQGTEAICSALTTYATLSGAEHISSPSGVCAVPSAPQHVMPNQLQCALGLTLPLSEGVHPVLLYHWGPDVLM